MTALERLELLATAFIALDDAGEWKACVSVSERIEDLKILVPENDWPAAGPAARECLYAAQRPLVSENSAG